ncbi:MAG: outer membrane protein transport protein [Bacteroidota bacterium]
MKKIIPIFLLIMLTTSFLYGGGFQINEHGARGMSLAGAFTAIANDPSAIYYNPAGLYQISGTRFYTGVTLIQPSASFRGPSPSITETKLEDQIFNPINFYVTHQVNSDLGIGIGVNNQYGLGTKWDPDWVGRYLAIETEIRTFFFTPTISYKVSDNFAIGAGLVFAYGDVLIMRKNSLEPFAGDAEIELEGDGTAWGFTLGILFTPFDDLSLGFSYRSETNFDFEGDAKAAAPPQFSQLLPTGKIAAPLTTPQNITLGLAYFATEQLTVSADLQFVGWSSYDKLEVTFNDVKDASGDKLVSTSVRNYNNTYIARFGAEYKFNDVLDLRYGLLYDKNPVDDEKVDPTLPDSDRLGFNFGFGYKITSKLSLDVAYMFLRFNEREIDNSEIEYTQGSAKFNGVYNSYAHLLGINLSYEL